MFCRYDQTLCSFTYWEPPVTPKTQSIDGIPELWGENAKLPGPGPCLVFHYGPRDTLPLSLANGQFSPCSPPCSILLQKAAMPHQQIPRSDFFVCLFQEYGIVSSPGARTRARVHIKIQRKKIPCHMGDDTEAHSERYLMLQMLLSVFWNTYTWLKWLYALVCLCSLAVVFWYMSRDFGKKHNNVLK